VSFHFPQEWQGQFLSTPKQHGQGIANVILVNGSDHARIVLVLLLVVVIDYARHDQHDCSRRSLLVERANSLEHVAAISFVYIALAIARFNGEIQNDNIRQPFLKLDKGFGLVPGNANLFIRE
jgi:hypothetical protein